MDNIKEFRKAIREGVYQGHTSGLFPDNAQFNVVIIPQALAADFKEFCQKNKTPCPLVYQSKPGEYLLSDLGDIDIRTDVPSYRVYREGALLEERADIIDYWEQGERDWVAFLLGCSFTFEYSLLQAGIPLKHVQEKKNVAMYKTNIDLETTQWFKGKMVVSMRWISPDRFAEVVDITGRYEHFHGAPIHKGDPRVIGIDDLTQPDYGEYVDGKEGDCPVFWGCGVTPQNCIVHAKLPLAITHKPGSMLISDLSHEQVLKMADPRNKVV